MARPREFDPEQVAEGLLNTFWLRGYAGTSIADLTAATNLLPGSLYAAFGNKEAMFLVAANRYASHMGTALSSDARGLEGVQTLLDTIIRLTASDPERRGCLIINAIPEAGSFSEDTQRHVQRWLRALRRTRPTIPSSSRTSSGTRDSSPSEGGDRAADRRTARWGTRTGRRRLPSPRATPTRRSAGSSTSR